jgi:hypothetical protein
MLVAFPQHPDEHRSQRPILLAVDQKFGEGARLGVPQYDSILSARSKSGSMSTWSSSARGADPRASRRSCSPRSNSSGRIGAGYAVQPSPRVWHTGVPATGAPRLRLSRDGVVVERLVPHVDGSANTAQNPSAMDQLPPPPPEARRASPPFWKTLVVLGDRRRRDPDRSGSGQLRDQRYRGRSRLTVASHECYAATRSLARGDGARARR